MGRPPSGSTRNGTEEEPFTRLTLALREYGPLAGTVGLILYGLLRLGYVVFYLQVRTTPEEVGYSYSRILSESIAGAVELMLISALLVATILCAHHLFLAPVLRRARRSERFPVGRTSRRRSGLAARRVAVRSLAVGAAIVFLSLPVLAWWQGGLAQRGQLVRNVYFVGIPYLPVLAVQAVPAEVRWKDGDKEKPLRLTDRNCLMYLGKADGTSIFYDVRTRESIRLPAGDVTVVLRFAFRVPDSCL